MHHATWVGPEIAVSPFRQDQKQHQIVIKYHQSSDHELIIMLRTARLELCIYGIISFIMFHV